MQSERSQDPRNLLFIDARSYNRWWPQEVSDDQIREVFDLMKWGPTSANCSPARFVFVRSESCKARLADCVSTNNRVKVEQAPFTIIVGMDEKFADRLPLLFPHAPSARHWFADLETARVTALRNSSLQGAYFMLAARLLGLDCGPMSGFDNAKLDAEFFAGTSIKSNFIFALGHGTSEMLFPRSPRLEFGEVCRFA
jgi:3-hydroxypropanoate dehydrogenase